MIISRAPLRISFAGGGTDLPEFWEKEIGAVLSTSIDKYIYISVHPYFEDKYLLKYSKTEKVDNLENIENSLFKESLRFLNIEKGIEITSTADLPTKVGMGSSCTFTVSLLHALHAHKGEHASKEQLAEEAYHIERDVLGKHCGKQDQYAAAFGGLNHIEFHHDGKVYSEPVICSREKLGELENNLMLFYTGETRDAGKILEQQAEETEEKRKVLRGMKDLSYEMRSALVKGDLDMFGELLHCGWMEKKKVTGAISNIKIDEYYRRGIDAGAKGGKVCGAGGGGFLMFYCKPAYQDNVREALKDLKEKKFKFESGGSRIIYHEG